MMQTLMVKLAPTAEQYDMLLATMKRFNEACNHIAEVALKERRADRIALGKIVYYPVRERFGLSAQMAVRAIAKVCEAYKRDKNIKPKFRKSGAMVYDQRILSWRKLEAVSILTLSGREIIPIRIGNYQRVRLDRMCGQTDLIYRKGVFYLGVVVEAPEPSKYDARGVLGVDLGIVHLAVDSDGEIHSGAKVNEVRDRTAVFRGRLQSAGTKSAKRHLRSLAGRERRFQRNVNHCISKWLVAKAKDTGRAIALEDLKGIRDQTTVSKAQRRNLHSWAFGQLRKFVEYKAALAGVPVVAVNPRGTSHICPECGFEARSNRKTRDEFVCVRCSFAGPADHVAAMNIAARAVVNPPIVPRDFYLSHSGSPSGTSLPFQ
jgi:putative transposase